MSQYELKEFTGTMEGETHKSSGMKIKPITGLILVFMAMLIAVGVGLIVHFAENRKLECTLPETNVLNGGGSNSKQQQGQGSVIISTQIDASTAAPIPATQIPSRDIRLPQTIKPYHYVLKLKPNMYSGDPSQFTFEGSVTIMMGAIQPSRTITLHAKDLNINNSTLRLSSMSGSAPRITSYTVYKSLDFLDIHLDGEISPGQNFSLVMEFTGPLKDDLHGLYYSSYTQGDKTVYLATTQFETLHARKAFPCFDEPAMKATFQVTLVRKKNLLSLSNMRITNNRTVADDFVEDAYDVTQKMSTYLLAFIVGDFKHKQRMVPNSNVTYGAWSRPELVNQTQLALDVGAQTTKIYNDFFKIPFPLPKQDMIALPDFRAGAMENWGLVTYRESYMLYDDTVSSASQKQSTVMVVTHELAHQWFGNLVTMQWWDDTWLNEGFARFMQYLSADKLYPEWKLFDQFVPSQLQLVLETDSYVTSHPLSSHADTADEIGDMFNGISYRKGGSIIRMVRFIMGEESFQKGLTRYLNAHKYENTVHDDLWRALTEQAVSEGKTLDITELMAPWTLQMNYPVVKVVKHSGHLLVSQERFLMNPDAKDPGKYTSSYGYRWPIPFTYTTESNPNFNVTDKDITWIKTDSKDIKVPSLQPSDWVIANIQEYGYYRVNYEDSNWLALIKVLNTNHKIIPAINRAQLINDAWSLSRAGKLSTDIALRTLEYLHNEQDYIPWYAARTQIQYLDRMLRGTENYGKLKEFLLDKLRMPYKQYGMSNVNITHIDELTQNLVAEMACSYGLAECVQSSQKMYDDWMSNPGVNSIDPNIQYTVYCTAIAEGNDEHWEFALQQLQKSQVATIRARLMAALACTRSTWLIRRYLQLSITPSIIRKQDAASVMSGIASSSTGQLFVWEFIRERWQSLNEYSGDAIPFSAIFSELASSFNTRFQLDQLKSFKDAHSELGRATTAYNSAVEEITSNINWIKNNLMTVTDWLDKAAKSSNSRVTDVRLPRHLIPNMYDVTLQPNMYSGNPETFTFDGHVKIYMTAKTAGSNVTLHVNKLNISDNTVRFARENGEPSPSYIAGSMKTDTERQFGIFFLDSSVIQGNNYTIELNFTAKLTNDLHGLYYSQYDRANETIYIATTQFESTDARRAFPCFDEPDIKAVFNTRLIRKSSMKSLSNMPIKQEVNMADDLVMDVYQRSQKMSTYLLAFIVCDFDYTESKTKSNITYKAWARPESKNQTAVALETGVKVIEHYEDYFGIGFPLPKQEMIAIPDFASGAMENWGLITYRETAMLYDPTDSSEGNKQRVKVVVAHELAHQWFGDLVTMKWWDDLWLNEGFASFVEYMGVDFVSPEWKMFEQFAFELQEVFEVDSLKTSHPIFVPVKNPVEIREIFDSISYAKGACVIRMMRFFLGESTFQKGLQIYLKNRKYDNADHDDLWAGLQEQAGTENKNINVSEVMDTWIKQMNYPVVKVTKADNGHISISQQRFLSNTETKDPGRYASPYGYMWKIPFTFTTKKHTTFNQTDENVHWLTTKQQEINETYPEIGDWIIGNIQQYGVYRVNYDEENWKLLVKQLKENHTRIGVINRAQIINDAFGLAKAKQLSMDIALSTLDYLDKEEAYVPWATGASELSYIGHMLADTELYGNFQRLMKKKVEHQFNRLGLNDTGTEHLDSYLRTTISSRACSNGNEECVNKAKDLFNQYKKNPKNNPISPNLRSVIYCTAIREGEEAEWQFISDQYKAATVPGEKSRLLSALTCTRQIWIINKLLHSSLDESFVRKQDSYSLYGYISQDPVGRCVAWDFFRANFQKIFDTYGNGAFSMTRIVKGIASTFNTEFQLQQLKDFKKEHPNLGTGTRALDQAIEQTQSNIKWMKDYYDIVEKWLLD